MRWHRRHISGTYKPLLSLVMNQVAAHDDEIVCVISAFGPQFFHAASQVLAVHATFIFLVYNVILVIKNNSGEILWAQMRTKPRQ